jgi:hypothetical protein
LARELATARSLSKEVDNPILDNMQAATVRAFAATNAVDYGSANSRRVCFASRVYRASRRRSGPEMSGSRAITIDVADILLFAMVDQSAPVR